MAETSQIEQITNGISFGKRSGSIIEIKKAAVEPDTIYPQASTTSRWARWGTDNNRPQQIIDENMEDGGSAGALRFKIQAHYGAGIQFYKRRTENDKEIIIPIRDEDLPDEMQDFFWNIDLENLQQGVVSDFEWWSFYYVQYIFSKSDKIIDVKWQRAKDVRSELRNKKTGNIDNYGLSGLWPYESEATTAVVPALDRSNPTSKPNAIYMHKLASIDKDYYPTPYWQSNLRWLAVAKKIPVWINSNIDNSVNIKYHIEIPQQYFLSLYPIEMFDNEQERMKAMTEAEEKLKDQIDIMLSGKENVSKIFYTKFATDENGEIIPGWKITELSNEVKDGAWLNAYGTAAAAIATAHGVPPSLQGLILSNGLGTGSGSDVREQFNFYLQLNTIIPRQTTQEWYNFVKRVNGWPKDIHMGQRNIILQSLNENRSGFATSNEAAPTSGSE